ncbi:hypothetical protein RM531_05775 [Salinisphaera sp. P385]|uniref:Uncharacterized protein n=1 Tax=Spectribacter acetivorans TaxID=3075603 RepID=A0ABU3B6B4_9GAMM|nr:hypothetical protein [Salinisphaera sp. P385]MDT0617974.1 hypothetical protein [Salinisphaera sp. P385]
MKTMSRYARAGAGAVLAALQQLVMTEQLHAQVQWQRLQARASVALQAGDVGTLLRDQRRLRTPSAESAGIAAAWRGALAAARRQWQARLQSLPPED